MNLTGWIISNGSRREGDLPEPLTVLTWSTLTANGEGGVSDTTELTLTFAADPVGLTADFITVHGATKGALTGTGMVRKLAISDIMANSGDNINVQLSNPPELNVQPKVRAVEVFKEDGDLQIEWQTLTANGTPGEVTTTELTLEFDADPGPLTTGSFILFNADITGISGTGTGRVLMINNVTDTALTLSVTSPTGYAISPDERSVTANIEEAAPNEITFISGVANGESDVTTSNSITLTFSEDPTGLAASDITVTGATKGALSGSGTTRALAISSLSVDDSQTVNVAIADNNDNTFSPNNRDVTVYVEAVSNPPIASGTFAPPAGNVDSAYFYDASALFTGGTPTSYALATGSLPAGVSFNTSTGVFSGTPTMEETEVGLSVTATNADGTSDPTNTASIVIEAALPEDDYLGFPKMSVSSISEPDDMFVMETSGEAPFLLQASAENVICTGTFDNVAYDINPITDLEHRWTVTKADESPVFYLGETKKGTARTTVNPATDTIGPNLSVWLHEPGTYTVTRVSRAPDGVGGYTSFTKTRTITISAMPTAVDHYWYSNTGDNANDGRDPHGFALSAATYTEATGELTEVGAFSGLTLSNHKGDYDIFNGDKIYIPGFGQRTIVSKESDDTIIISPKLGSNQTGLTSSNGPKASWSFSNGRIPINTFHHIKGGDTFALSNRLETQNDSSGALTSTVGFAAYDGVANLIGHTSGLLVVGNNSSRYQHKKAFFGKIVMDPNAVVNRAITGFVSAGAMTAGTRFRMWFDQVRITDDWQATTPDRTQNAITFNSDFTLIASIGFTNGEVNNITDDVTPSRAVGIYAESGPNGFESFIGNIVDNDANSSTFDHHYYPSGLARLHIGFDYCRGGRNNGYNYNVNDSNMSGGGRPGPLAIHDVVTFNARYFSDYADVSNTQDSETENFYIARADAVDILEGFLFSVSNRGTTILDCTWWSPADGAGKKGMLTLNSEVHTPAQYHWKAARNLAVNAPVVRDRTIYGPIGWQLYDNKVWSEDATDGEGFELKVDSLPTGVEVFADGNEVYAPIPYTLDGTEVTAATFNTAVGGTNTVVGSFTLPTKPSIV